MLVSLSVTEELIIMKSEHVGQVAPACSSKEGAVDQFAEGFCQWFRKTKKEPCSPLCASSWV